MPSKEEQDARVQDFFEAIEQHHAAWSGKIVPRRERDPERAALINELVCRVRVGDFGAVEQAPPDVRRKVFSIVASATRCEGCGL